MAGPVGLVVHKPLGPLRASLAVDSLISRVLAEVPA